MPRVIFKCPHIKGGTEQAASHLQNYVEYMSTRKGVDEIDPSEAVLPATKRQRQLAAQILRDFPLSRGMFEYEDYRTSPTRGNASEFIARALEKTMTEWKARELYQVYCCASQRISAWVHTDCSPVLMIISCSRRLQMK